MSNAAAAAVDLSLAEKQAEANEKIALLQQQVFLDVMASRGYAADTAEKQAELLETGRLVSAGIHQLRQTKQAAEHNLVKSANAALSKQFGETPAKPEAGQAKLAAEIEELARGLAAEGWGSLALTAGGASANG